jgi:hypothetical protein
MAILLLLLLYCGKPCGRDTHGEREIYIATGGWSKQLWLDLIIYSSKTTRNERETDRQRDWEQLRWGVSLREKRQYCIYWRRWAVPATPLQLIINCLICMTSFILFSQSTEWQKWKYLIHLTDSTVSMIIITTLSIDSFTIETSCDKHDNNNNNIHTTILLVISYQSRSANY